MLFQSRSLLASFAALVVTTGVSAQTPTNPFRSTYGWGLLPTGCIDTPPASTCRKMGSTSAIQAAPDGMSIWVAERCGANTCVTGNTVATMDPVLHYDLNGKLLGSFGAGKFAWPHGIFVDPQGNIWIADGERPGANVGNAVLKFSPAGQLLMTIGTPGKAGVPPMSMTQPNDIVVSPRTGNIFVSEGHSTGAGINDILVYDATGKYLRTIGKTGYGPIEFHEPHALAFDSQGRLFVGDRYNNRIQIMDEDGKMIAIWTQFGRPSGIFIDKNDVIYVADSESSPDTNNITGMRNAGWEKGIRIGDAKTGWLRYFIPDTKTDPSGFSGAEGVAVDANGAVYGAEVSQMRLAKHVMYHPPHF